MVISWTARCWNCCKNIDNVQKFVMEKYFFAKIASWVKDGVPSLAREYTGGTARPSPGIR